MTAREWKPGDVALFSVRGKDSVAVRNAANDGWEHSGVFGGGAAYDDIGGFTVRPLVVIDPEDREQAERMADALVDAMCESDPEWDKARAYEVRAHMRAALREFANPTPPKPDEPTGLGAVVEDAEGRLWVRLLRDGDDSTRDDWRRAGYTHGDESRRVWHHYADIAAVKVLSDGVSP